MNYSSNLNDKEFKIIEKYIPRKLRTKPRLIAYKDILNGIFYQLKNACTWRDLPHDFPKWQTVYYYFNMWKEDGTLDLILVNLHKQERLRVGKKLSQQF